jgi:1-pyrroline-5-carboxylate dehydrogenase
MMVVPDTSLSEARPFVERMRGVPRSGLHNPIKNPERYNMLGEVCTNAARELAKPEVFRFFQQLIQRLCQSQTSRLQASQPLCASG